MKVTLLSHTPEVEKTISLAAKLCYSDSNIDELEDRVRGISYEDFLGKILKMGHLSVLEHANFTFGIEGISRAASHQLVRHRLASYSQQSQRYVDARKRSAEYVTPDTIKTSEEAGTKYEALVSKIYGFYEEMVSLGIPKEDARFILPNAASTKIIVTMNARELLHFFKVRCCERAQWEIREMAILMLKAVKHTAPSIFKGGGPACVEGPCSEGEMTCGHPKEIRKKFQEL
ncbi:MAG: FAD-dependent thymidylate synthase [Deltaproteobacteria bacterium]|nr:FAD-dependent thymidylate synthase [Deltaproteobacteria bacterium]